MYETSACAPGPDFSKGGLIDTMVQLTTCKQWLNFVDFLKKKTNTTNALDFNSDAKKDFDLTQYYDLVFFVGKKLSQVVYNTVLTRD